MSTNFGRPRDTSVDAAITAATESVLLADGYAAVSIDRIAKFAGTTRAAVYRRIKSRGELVVGLLIRRFGTDPAPDSGELRRDLRLLQDLQRVFFTDPVVQAGLAGVLSDIRSDTTLGAVVYESFIAPRRKSVAAMLGRAVDRGETGPITDPARIFDILTGPLMLRALLPTIGPIDNVLIQATIDAALAQC